MIEVFRHAPRTGVGVPAASFFAETNRKHLGIALRCVELIFQVLDVRRVCTHAPYCIVRKWGLSILSSMGE